MTHLVNVKLEKSKEFDDEIQQLSEALENATRKVQDLPHYVHVPAVDNVKNVFQSVKSMSNVPSYMLCGPRGVG